MKTQSHLLPYFILASIVLSFLPIQNVWAESWLYRILLAGPSLFVPVGILFFADSALPLSQNSIFSFISALLLLLAAYCLPAGVTAAVLGIPWLLFVVALALHVIRHQQQFPLAWILACCFLPVAAAWMFADRLGWQPLGFDPLIVLLTGIHFHYAGFALASVAALLPASKAQSYLSWGLLPGVAGVAIGITNTQLGGPAVVEIVGVTTMVAVGIGIATLQVRHAWLSQLPPIPRLLLTLGGIALAGGLSLALLYGWRFHYQWNWLTIPWMYATHGLLNSLGFSLLSFTGHHLARYRQ